MNPTPEQIEKARLIVYRWQKRWTDAGETCMPHVDDLRDRISVALSDAEQSASADDCDDVDAMLAALPPALTWTTQKPTKEGNYWWRENQAYSEKIVSVTSSYAGKSYVYFPGQSSGKDLDNVGGEWAGPMEPPQ